MKFILFLTSSLVIFSMAPGMETTHLATTESKPRIILFKNDHHPTSWKDTFDENNGEHSIEAFVVNGFIVDEAASKMPIITTSNTITLAAIIKTNAGRSLYSRSTSPLQIPISPQTSTLTLNRIFNTKKSYCTQSESHSPDCVRTLMSQIHLDESNTPEIQTQNKKITFKNSAANLIHKNNFTISPTLERLVEKTQIVVNGTLIPHNQQAILDLFEAHKNNLFFVQLKNEDLTKTYKTLLCRIPDEKTNTITFDSFYFQSPPSYSVSICSKNAVICAETCCALATGNYYS